MQDHNTQTVTLSQGNNRVENSKGYEPSNCRWATTKEQANNRRSPLTYEDKLGDGSVLRAVFLDVLRNSNPVTPEELATLLAGATVRYMRGVV